MIARASMTFSSEKKTARMFELKAINRANPCVIPMEGDGRGAAVLLLVAPMPRCTVVGYFAVPVGSRAGGGRFGEICALGSIGPKAAGTVDAGVADNAGSGAVVAGGAVTAGAVGAGAATGGVVTVGVATAGAGAGVSLPPLVVSGAPLLTAGAAVSAPT